MRRELARFLMAGVVGFLIDTGMLYLMLWLGLGYFAGRAVSFLCAVWTTWQVNRRYTFTPDRRQSIWAEWWRYLTAMSVGGGVNYAAYSAVVSLLHPAPWLPLLAVAAGSIAGLLVNFATAKWWVFKRTKPITDESC
ncbi:GtrA family protein [Trinickia symbiotica]|uniref:GtrA family protein n=2 Tax=Trinickia symbiotica TaxID=863227 RepID=A0A2T3XW76_9BURK|nr:GtrA family protein [Trinickia symbiotica]